MVSDTQWYCVYTGLLTVFTWSTTRAVAGSGGIDRLLIALSKIPNLLKALFTPKVCQMFSDFQSCLLSIWVHVPWHHCVDPATPQSQMNNRDIDMVYFQHKTTFGIWKYFTKLDFVNYEQLWVNNEQLWVNYEQLWENNEQLWVNYEQVSFIIFTDPQVEASSQWWYWRQQTKPCQIHRRDFGFHVDLQTAEPLILDALWWENNETNLTEMGYHYTDR